jgi:hypothetical protein
MWERQSPDWRGWLLRTEKRQSGDWRSQGMHFCDVAQANDSQAMDPSGLYNGKTGDILEITNVEGCKLEA